jgi:hypothetical protein
MSYEDNISIEIILRTGSSGELLLEMYLTIQPQQLEKKTHRLIGYPDHKHTLIWGAEKVIY